MAEKEIKYVVIKLSHLRTRLTVEEQDILCTLLKKLSNSNNYIVCNQDEPYADKVWQTILEGEDANLDNSKCPRCGSWEGLKFPRGLETYCEDCGWPGEEFGSENAKD